MTTGPTIALGCAVTWALALILWRKVGAGVPARALNFFKNGFSLILLIPTLLMIEGFSWPSISSSDLAIILLSGAGGIGIADGLYLWALELIGPSRLAIIDCLYTPTVVLFSWLVLGEELTPFRILGGLLVLLAALAVSVEKSTPAAHKSQIVKGGIICAIAIMIMSLGIVGLKPVFSRVPLFWIVTLRLAVGTLVSLLGILISPQRVNIFRKLVSASGRSYLVLASFCGTYLSMVLWVSGFKYNDASVAAVLTQTSTVLTVILAALFLDERLDVRKLFAVGTSMLGVLILSMD